MSQGVNKSHPVESRGSYKSCPGGRSTSCPGGNALKYSAVLGDEV